MGAFTEKLGAVGHDLTKIGETMEAELTADEVNGEFKPEKGDE